uniref:No apical meristem-associated C-terminal domain-containing protein n=1 Tax=Tanacetum cinerariifolium TaxID=118510 RepID=A0A699H6X5_TANCI|nr:hypothetical protein [Tanacetum cinerariifolium]
MSLIPSFPNEDMYEPQYADFHQNTAREDSPVKITSSSQAPALLKLSKRRQKMTNQNEDVPRCIAWSTEEEIVLCKGWVHVPKHSAIDDEEDEVQEVERPMGRDKAKCLKKKGAGASGSSATTNDEALTRLMVSELAMHHERFMAMKKEECLAFLNIRKRELEIHKRELAMQEYKQCQKDIMFYTQPYNQLTRDALKQMEYIRMGIKAKGNLPY